MATDLTTLLEGGVILPSFEATSRKQAIHALAEALGEATGLSARQIEDAVMERERLGSTGVGEGVAIPHARVEGIDRPIGGYMRLVHGVDFEAIIRALNDVKYSGPLSVEWEDIGMDREHGAAEAVQFVKQLDFKSSGRAFDADFEVK